jgi:chromosome segregation ATPase
MKSMLDDTIHTEQKHAVRKVQRSIQVPEDIWEAGACIPGGRTKFIIEAMANEVAARKSELPKLRMELEKDYSDLHQLQSSISAKESRIAELVAEQENELKEAIRIQGDIEQAVIETGRLLKDFRKGLTHAHYRRLSDLSGTPALHIEAFIKETKYRPSEEQIREFFLR